jgi:uncharacterized protein
MGRAAEFGCWRFFFTNGVWMRFNVSHLVQAPLMTRDAVHLEVDEATLGDDLLVHHMRGEITFTRTSRGLLAEGLVDVSLDGECARCLTTFPLPLEIQLDDLRFALPQTPAEGDEYRTSEHGWVDMTQALREQILLNIPLSAFCRPDCHGLCDQCGQDLNVGTCDCDTQSIDPRLEALRGLL